MKFHEEFSESVERAIGPLVEQVIKSLLHAKLPPHLRKSIKSAYPENEPCDQIVAHLVFGLKLSGLEMDGELPIP